MADGTKIEWTDATWNPVGGCAVHSPGCTNCYAQRIAGSGRLRNHPLYRDTTTPSKAGPVFNGHLTVAPDDHPVWTWPLRWRGAKVPRRGPGARSTIFVGDMSDLFHKDRPDEHIDRVFAVMALCPQFDFQVLTKRADRMREYITAITSRDRVETLAFDRVATNSGRGAAENWLRAGPGWPLPNVWLGVSVEDQARADERIPLLLATPAAVRFISAEPLLGPVDLSKLPASLPSDAGVYRTLDALTGASGHNGPCGWTTAVDRPREHLDWVIAGGESGPGARPMHPDWVRSLRDQCAAAEVPFFFKQWGEWAPSNDLPVEIVWRREQATVLPDGSVREWQPGFPESRLTDPDMRGMTRRGKKLAGALLDGREHREFPR